MSPLITPGNEQIRFRPGRSALIPYIQFELGEKNEPLLISEISIGPSLSGRLIQAAVLSLVQQHKIAIDPSRIVLPNIPYHEP
jgi:hypothetical protein